jgi:hypothetical protein
LCGLGFPTILSVSLPSKAKYSTVKLPFGKAKLVSILVNAPSAVAFSIVVAVEYTIPYKTPSSSYTANTLVSSKIFSNKDASSGDCSQVSVFKLYTNSP